MPLTPYSIIQSQVKTALAEDIGPGDLTAALVPEATRGLAKLLVREQAILCGSAWFNEVFKQLGDDLDIQWNYSDGDQLPANQPVCQLSGDARTILTGERTALNFLQTLSATATITAAYVNQLGNSNVKLLDTRKTIPGFRAAQKYAVLCGGGANHRHGLFDGVLLKENHILAAGSISQAIATARKSIPHTLKIEVEVETLAEVEEALGAEADILLLDNMSHEMIKLAVQMNSQQFNRQARLEVSGNITLDSIAALAALGIDFISTGAITKHIRAIDFSLRFE